MSAPGHAEICWCSVCNPSVPAASTPAGTEHFTKSDPIREAIRREAAEYLAICDALERCTFDAHRAILDDIPCGSCGLTLRDYLATVPTCWPAKR